MALASGLPVARSQRTVVSRWLVMAIARICAAVTGLPSTPCDSTLRITASCEPQISDASCSTQPGRGNTWGNSCCADPAHVPLASTRIARELVVPWSSERMYWVSDVTGSTPSEQFGVPPP